MAMALVLWLGAAVAQTQPGNVDPPKPGAVAPASAEARAAYDEAFQATLDKPADPATLLHFAEAAVQVGDLEGAISVLERLLLIDGDQPEIKLELGVLYFRLGSADVARTYLEAARDSDSASDDIRKRADTFLKEDMKR